MMPAQGVFGKKETTFFLTFGTCPNADENQYQEIDSKNQPVKALHVVGLHSGYDFVLGSYSVIS